MFRIVRLAGIWHESLLDMDSKSRKAAIFVFIPSANINASSIFFLKLEQWSATQQDFRDENPEISQIAEYARKGEIGLLLKIAPRLSAGGINRGALAGAAHREDRPSGASLFTMNVRVPGSAPQRGTPLPGEAGKPPERGIHLPKLAPRLAAGGISRGALAGAAPREQSSAREPLTHHRSRK